VSKDHILVNRDFYNNQARPGYVPFVYPHPLTLVDSMDTTSPGGIAAVNDGTGTDADVTASAVRLSANWTAAADPESGILKYRYGIGTSPGAANTVGWTDNAGTSVTRAGLSLTVGAKYYFSVAAVNGAGLEGAAANSDGQVVISGPDVTAPKISNVSVINITETGATITWDTDEDATSRVLYGTDISYANNKENINLATSHSMELTGLTPGTRYHYAVAGRDEVGNETASLDHVFITLNREMKVRIYPNPFVFSSGGGVMTFALEETGNAELKIYTISGRLVKKLVIESGRNEVTWNMANEAGKSITCGLYIYALTDSKGNRRTGKIAITK